MIDFTKTGGVAIAMSEFGVVNSVELSHFPHGTMAIQAMLLTPFTGTPYFILFHNLISIFTQAMVIVFLFVILRELEGEEFAFIGSL